MTSSMEMINVKNQKNLSLKKLPCNDFSKQIKDSSQENSVSENLIQIITPSEQPGQDLTAKLSLQYVGKNAWNFSTLCSF